MGIYIYSIIVTIILLLTDIIFAVYIVRKNNRRSPDFDTTKRELQESRTTIERVRDELTKCRDILNDNGQGVEGVIERLRRIAEEVEVLENIISNSNTT